MSTSGAAGRRDTPAARAALARRRQRAAQSLRPAANVATTFSAPPTRITSTTGAGGGAAAAAPSSRPPTGISSPPRVRPAMPTSQLPPPTTTMNQPKKLTVDTTPPAATAAASAFYSSTTIASTSTTSGGGGGATTGTRMTQLTRRAHDNTKKQKSPSSSSIMDATMTTAALTAVTTTTTTGSTGSTMASPPEQQHHASPLARYTSSPSSTMATTAMATPQQALSNSKQAAEQANSILNAVTARNRYRSSNSPKVGESSSSSSVQEVSAAADVVGVAGQQTTTHKASSSSSPSRLAQQEELLAASKQRRQALESSSSRQRFTTTTTTTTTASSSSTTATSNNNYTRGGVTAASSVSSTTALGAQPVMTKAMTNPRYLRGASKSPSPIRNASSSSSSPRTTPSMPRSHTGGTTIATTDDSPLLARMEKLDLSSADSQRRIGGGGRVAQLPTQRNIASPQSSPRRFPASPNATPNLPPPSPRQGVTGKSPRPEHHRRNLSEESPDRESRQQAHVQQVSSSILHQQQQQQQYRLQARPRTPSPNRRKTSSPWIEKNVSHQMQRPRPTPVQTSREQQQQQQQRSPGRTSLQVRAMAEARGRSSSPRQRQSPQGGGLANQSPYYHSNTKSGTNSPGVQPLSAFLMDTSVAEASTIADMTMHQMDTPPRNKNMSFVQQQSSQTPTFKTQPYHSPQYRQAPSVSDTADYSMTMAASHDQTPSSNRHGAYRPIDDYVEEDDEEDEATLDPSKVQTIDSSCLRSGSTILLRSYSQPTTVEIERKGKGGKEKYCVAALTGQGLGRDDEILTIQKVIATSEGGSQYHGEVTPNLRHGDTVLLYSAAAGNRALGSRKFVNSAGTASKLELGFFSATGSQAEIWTILKARPDREVLVGRAALTASNQSKDSSSVISGMAMPAPVRSSDPIILRNCYNGGILSVNFDGKLVLLTDSYQHQQQQQSHFDDPSLLGQLLHHDRLYPTPRDTFQMILSSIPPCPPWVAARSTDERIFLTGSYLLQPRRNQRSEELESNIFAGNSHVSPILEAAQRYIPSDENLSPQTKERILIDEVIGSFLGLEGRHIRLKAARGHSSTVDHFEFQLFEADGVTFDIGLRNLVEQILPLSTSFVRVRNFVSSRHPGYEYGRVMQAFCEALDALLQDYVNFVSQLEWDLRKYSKSDILTMKSIYFQITPSLHSMSILEHATEAVCESKGGELINALWSLDKRKYMGDSMATKVLAILLDKTSEPYMDMLSDWLQTGKLNDPYEEFMVQRGATNGRGPFDGDSWSALFQINEDHVVQGIAPNGWTKEKIMTTGKYWNAVQECRLDLKDHPGPTKQSKIPKLPFNSDSSAIASFIDSKYQSASKVLVRILMDHFKLLESLEIMKRYFLIDQGEFLANFLDAAEQELLKPRDEISMGRLQHWLNMSVQLTEAYKEEWDPVSGMRVPSTSCPLFPAGLRCRLSEETLVAHLDSLYGGGIADLGPVTPSRRAYGTSFHGPTGIEVFTIDFPRVPFPISLLLSQKVMSDYKLLFRHLFFTKHVERRLIAVWRDHQLLKKLDSLRGLLGGTFLLRQRMLHFIQNLIYYMVFEVVESHWMDMRNVVDDKSWGPSGRMEKQQTVDDILEVHSIFLKRTLEACLLTNSDLIRSLTKLMNTCLLFTDQMKRFMDTTKIHDDSLNRAAEKRGAVQRNLNERNFSQGQLDKRALRKALASTKEERQAIHNRQTRRVGREVSSESYQRMVRRFDEVFTQDLANFMRQLNAHTSSGIVANLGIRLDYNGYVTATIAKNNRS